jgi:hypothetical protein
MPTRSPTALFGYVILPQIQLWPTKKTTESSTCTIKNLSDNENIHLKMPSLLWQGDLPNRASKIKQLDLPVMIFICPVQVLSYTSALAL